MSDLPAERLPFLWGAQYYRAPTPAASCWVQDLDRMQAMGFTDVKLWAQWGWTQRAPDTFYFDDLDTLLDLAGTRGLRVTINTIFDVAPAWFLARHPESRQITADGQVVLSRAVAFRQIGGFPGPCLRHPQGLAERRRFLEATVRHCSGHPALAMWDVWNEPEQSFPSREPKAGNYVCYCRSCQAAFIPFLQARHRDLEALNQRWGRCYQRWEEVLPPLNGETFVDWLDWREFQLDGMTQEARWRLERVRALDPGHPRYLHVVPNTMDVFNAVSGADDFALSDLGPGEGLSSCFAATCNGGPQWMHQLISAGHAQRVYNVESHINFGNTAMHQRLNGLSDVRRDLLPQLGLGITGFLFWQFRSETLGQEGPAWGIVRTDGSPRPVTRAVEALGRALAPHHASLLTCQRATPRIGIWKSRRNELFHYAAHGTLTPLIEAVDGYVQALYWHSLPFRFVNEVELAEAAGAAGPATTVKPAIAGSALADIQLLILPSPYCLGADEARGLEAFLARGGQVLSEAHLGAWNPESGRHAATVPGQGLSARWGLVESDSTATGLLALGQVEQVLGPMSDDVRKAFKEAGASGGQFVPIVLETGSRIWGCERLAILAGSHLEVLGRCAGLPCVGTVAVAAGRVTYVGTRWGQSARKDPEAFAALLRRITAQAGVVPTGTASTRGHIDVLSSGGMARFVVGVAGDADTTIRADLPGTWRGVFSAQHGSLASGLTVEAGTAELFIPA